MKMYRPQVVTPPDHLPVTVAEMKKALRIIEWDAGGNVLPHEDDAQIEEEIRSAVAHYEGWAGILGIALCRQQWRQDFNQFGDCMRLPIAPVDAADMAMTWRSIGGSESTVSPASYVLRIDGGGQASVRFVSGFSYPSGLASEAAVSVQYWTGWPAVDGVSTVPADIKTAIKFRVQIAYDEAARENAVHLERVENSLIGKYRRMSV